MGTIDGTNWSDVTIDGQPVQEITVDGSVVWISEVPYNLFNMADSYELFTNGSISNIDYDTSTGALENFVTDSQSETHNGITFYFNNGTTEDFFYQHQFISWSGSGSTQGDRDSRIFSALDNNDNLIFRLSIQSGHEEVIVYDTGGSTSWTELSDSSNIYFSGIDVRNFHNFNITWDGNYWNVSVNNGQWTYQPSKNSSPIYTIRSGGNEYGSHGQTDVYKRSIYPI